MSRITRRISAFVIRHPRFLCVVSLIIVLAAAATTLRLHLDPDILKLVPQNNREVKEFRDVLQETGTIDFHVVVLKLPAGTDASTYYPLLDSLGERFQKSPLIQQATWRVPEVLEIAQRAIPYSMLVLTPEQLDRVAAKLSDDEIRTSVARNKTLLQTPQSSMMKQVVKIDPFNLLPIYLEKLPTSGGGFNADLSTGYYLSHDHSVAILMLKPKRPAQDFRFSRKLRGDSDAIMNAATSEFRKANPGVAMPEIGYTGGYAIATADEHIIKEDIVLNVLTSVLGVLALFLYALRRPAALVYAGVPMGAAIIVTFGIASLAFGRLSASSTGFAALLSGLGVDFITILYERYVDERNRGASVVEAIHAFMAHSMPGVAIAAATTAATFFGFLATDFRGMTELGFLTGAGILVFLLFVVFLFPAILVLVERRRPETKKLHVHSFGSSRLVAASLRRPRMTLAIWAIVVLVASLFATRVKFSDNIQNLRSTGNEGVILQEFVTKKFGGSFDFMMYAVRGRTAEEAIAKTQRAIPELNRFVKDGAISSYQSIGTILPPEAQQRAAMERLRKGANDEFSMPRIEKTFRAALAENGFRESAYDEWLPLFDRALHPTAAITLATLKEVGLGDAVQRFIRPSAQGFVSVTYLYPNGKKWPRNLPADLQSFRDHPSNEGVLTGINLVSQALRTIIKADAVRASLLGTLVVFALLVIGFRSLGRAVLVFVPFLAGISCMLGVMAAFGLEFNFMNIFIGLMLVGTATDYAVYMLQRYDESPQNYPHGAAETARAVVLAALTSIVGFGSFAISHYPGLRSIGYAATFGVLGSCLAAISLLPALLATGKFDRKKPAPDALRKS